MTQTGAKKKKNLKGNQNKEKNYVDDDASWDLLLTIYGVQKGEGYVCVWKDKVVMRCVCVCACGRERDRQRERELLSSLFPQHQLCGFYEEQMFTT